jgi:SAM-dependent methyltransferase
MDLREVPRGRFERHPWEIARARFFSELLVERTAELRKPLTILDVGAGDGYLARTALTALGSASRAVCFDPNYASDELGRGRNPQRGLEFTRELPEQRFDVLLLLDVIEHVADARAFVADLVGRYLAPGGCVIVSVPAYLVLFTAHDIALGHHRRYRPGELRDVLEAAGLRVERAGGLFHSLLAVRAVEKMTELARGRRSVPQPAQAPAVAETDAGAWQAGRRVTRIVTQALALDTWFSKRLARARVELPGLSAWAIGIER